MKILKGLKSGWMWFAEKVGYINSTILLTVVFFVFIGIYAILAKFFSLFMRRKSGWRFFEQNQNSLEDLKKEF